MAGHHPFDNLRQRMTADRRSRNAARTQELLRQMRGTSQTVQLIQQESDREIDHQGSILGDRDD